MGTRWLGAEMLRRLVATGRDTCLVTDTEGNAATRAAQELGQPWTAKPDRVALMASDLPWRPDLIVCAHSFRILPPWVIWWARLGAIGYHPSMLPAFKGRHAVQDALNAGNRITGGTVYWLTEALDGGPPVIAHGARLQRQVQVLPGESAADLWRRALAPLGAEMLMEAVVELTVQPPVQ